MAERIAITASASRSGGALAPLEGFDASGFGSPLGSQIWKAPEEPEDDPALRILGPHGRLFDALAREVHDAAGLQALPRERVGLFAAMGMVDSPVGDLLPAAEASCENGTMDWETFYGGAYRRIHPLWPLSMLNNVAVGQVSIDLDIRGDNLVLASDADGGLRAVLEAASAVRQGSCDAAVAGGVSGRISPFALARMRLQGRGDVPLGEGGAAFVLEREAEARARGSTVLARVLGGASAFGACDEHPGPDERAVERAVRTALDRAAVDAADVPVVSDAPAGPSREAVSAGVAAAGIPRAARGGSGGATGHLGAGDAMLDLHALVLRLGDAERRPGRDRSDARRALVVACGSEGGVGALILEAVA